MRSNKHQDMVVNHERRRQRQLNEIKEMSYSSYVSMSGSDSDFDSNDDSTEDANESHLNYVSRSGTLLMFSSSFGTGISSHDPSTEQSSIFSNLDDHSSLNEIDSRSHNSNTGSQYSSSTWKDNFIFKSEDDESIYKDDSRIISPRRRVRPLMKGWKKNKKKPQGGTIEHKALLSNKAFLDEIENSTVVTSEPHNKALRCVQFFRKPLQKNEKTIDEVDSKPSVPKEIKLNNPRAKGEKLDRFDYSDEERSVLSTQSILPKDWTNLNLWGKKDDTQPENQPPITRSPWNCEPWKSKTQEESVNNEEGEKVLSKKDKLKKKTAPSPANTPEVENESLFYKVWYPNEASNSNSLLIESDDHIIDMNYNADVDGNYEQGDKGSKNRSINQEKKRRKLLWRRCFINRHLEKRQIENGLDEHSDKYSNEEKKEEPVEVDVLANLFWPKDNSNNYEDFISSYFWPKATDEERKQNEIAEPNGECKKEKKGLDSKEHQECNNPATEVGRVSCVNTFCAKPANDTNVQGESMNDKKCVDTCITPSSNTSRAEAARAENEEVGGSKDGGKNEYCMQNLFLKQTVDNTGRDSFSVKTPNNASVNGERINQKSCVGCIKPNLRKHQSSTESVGEDEKDDTCMQGLFMKQNQNNGHHEEGFVQRGSNDDGHGDNEMRNDGTIIQTIRTRFYYEQNKFLDQLEDLFLGPDERALYDGENEI